MFRIRDFRNRKLGRHSVLSILIIAIYLLLTALISAASAQPFITVSTGDVELDFRDSVFKVPIYLQSLNDSIGAFQIVIAFDNPEAVLFDFENPISDSAEVIWNWGFGVSDFGVSNGTVIKIISGAMPQGDPIPPSETVHQLFVLNALAGDSVNEYHCDFSGFIHIDSYLTQFSNPLGSELIEFTVENGSYDVLCPECGDANYDSDVNVSDGVYIINYVFTGGFAPVTNAAGDVNCDGECNVSDAVAIINYVFVGGNDPCDTDGDGEPDC
jgi:hypothetical protein